MFDANDYLHDTMSAYEASVPDFKATPLQNPNNKWLVRSALQKAIRRGNVDEAMMCAALLYGTDIEYAWSGIRTTVVEDVGYPNWDLLNVTCVCNLKGFTEGHDRAKLFGGLVYAAANATMKTRANCELELGANTQCVDRKIVLEHLSDKNLIDFLSGGDLDDMYLALNILRQRSRHGNEELLNTAVAEMKGWLSDHEGPSLFAPLFMWERPVDSMSYALWPLMFHNVFEGAVPYDDVFPPSEKILTVSSEAFDMHTRAGKRAIRAFNNSLKHKQTILKSIAGDCVKPIGCALFIVEGGLMTNKLRSPDLDELRAYQDKGFGDAYGQPTNPATRAELIQFVADNIPLINEKRKWSSTLD